MSRILIFAKFWRTKNISQNFWQLFFIAQDGNWSPSNRETSPPKSLEWNRGGRESARWRDKSGQRDFSVCQIKGEVHADVCNPVKSMNLKGLLKFCKVTSPVYKHLREWCHYYENVVTKIAFFTFFLQKSRWGATNSWKWVESYAPTYRQGTRGTRTFSNFGPAEKNGGKFDTIFCTKMYLFHC